MEPNRGSTSQFSPQLAALTPLSFICIVPASSLAAADRRARAATLGSVSRSVAPSHRAHRLHYHGNGGGMLASVMDDPAEGRKKKGRQRTAQGSKDHATHRDNGGK